jgi:hypothetical protein
MELKRNYNFIGHRRVRLCRTPLFHVYANLHGNSKAAVFEECNDEFCVAKAAVFEECNYEFCGAKAALHMLLSHISIHLLYFMNVPFIPRYE